MGSMANREPQTLARFNEPKGLVPKPDRDPISSQDNSGFNLANL